MTRSFLQEPRGREAGEEHSRLGGNVRPRAGASRVPLGGSTWFIKAGDGPALPAGPKRLQTHVLPGGPCNERWLTEGADEPASLAGAVAGSEGSVPAATGRNDGLRLG